MGGIVEAVSSSPAHSVAKPNRTTIRLLVGLGVEGDAHLGETVQHRSRVVRDPSQPNLRQVHLLHSELLDQLRELGFDLTPGEIGENITTRGLDLLTLPRATRLTMGSAIVEITGLRNPCSQLDGIAPGLMAATLERDASGHIVRKAGVMSVVLAAGEITAGQAIDVELPSRPWSALEPV